MSETLTQRLGGNTEFTYGMNEPNKRRKLPPPKITSESVQLNANGRVQGQSNAQQAQRDLALIPWMMRRHLDYVSPFKPNFESRKDEDDAAGIALDEYIASLLGWHAQPENFDIAARMGREEFFRMFELEKTTGGDAGILKLNKLLKMQAIESDLIAYPKQGKEHKNGKVAQIPKAVKDNVHRNDGVVYDDAFPGRVKEWCLCSRGKNGKELRFAQLVPRESMIFGAYYGRYSSQTRGISPLSTVLNNHSDMFQSIDLNLVKQRLHSLMGIAIFRDYSGGEWSDEAGDAAGEESDTDDAAATGTTESGIELKPDKVSVLDMDVNGRADMLESKTPSDEFRAFVETLARIIMLGLDIPYSAWNSGESSFASILADQNMYEVSCKFKRRKNRWARREYSDWLLTEAWNRNPMVPDFGNLQELAAAAGMTLDQVKAKLEWVASGMPWLQKIQEVTGDILAIAAGLDNPEDAAKRRGGNVYRNIEKTRRVLAAAGDDVPMAFGTSGGIRSTAELVEAVNGTADTNSGADDE